VSLRHEGYFVISTEVGAEVRQAAVQEIFKEIEILRSVPVGDEELQKVKNYMSGSLLRNLDGPFEKAERMASLLPHGAEMDYYRSYFERINSVSSGEILALADGLLSPESFIEVVAGK
jgi:predicted Zn-dependent peptidase